MEMQWWQKKKHWLPIYTSYEFITCVDRSAVLWQMGIIQKIEPMQPTHTHRSDTGFLKFLLHPAFYCSSSKVNLKLTTCDSTLRLAFTYVWSRKGERWSRMLYFKIILKDKMFCLYQQVPWEYGHCNEQCVNQTSVPLPQNTTLVKILKFWVKLCNCSDVWYRWSHTQFKRNRRSHGMKELSQKIHAELHGTQQGMVVMHIY